MLQTTFHNTDWVHLPGGNLLNQHHQGQSLGRPLGTSLVVLQAPGRCQEAL